MKAILAITGLQHTFKKSVLFVALHDIKWSVILPLTGKNLVLCFWLCFLCLTHKGVWNSNVALWIYLTVAPLRSPHILQLDPHCVVSERPAVPFGGLTHIHLFVGYYVLLRELSFWFSRFVLQNFQSFPIRSCQDWVTQDRFSHTIYLCLAIFLES